MDEERLGFSDVVMILTSLILAGSISYLFWMGLIAEAERLTNHGY